MVEYLWEVDQNMTAGYQDKVAGRDTAPAPIGDVPDTQVCCRQWWLLGDGHACDVGKFVIWGRRYGINMAKRDICYFFYWNVLLGPGDPARCDVTMWSVVLH